jgi:hypothetical protein
VHSQKAGGEISTTELGITTDYKLKQLANVPAPKDTIPLGIVIDCKVGCSGI